MRLWGSLTNLACQRLASFVYEFTVCYEYLSTFKSDEMLSVENWVKKLVKSQVIENAKGQNLSHVQFDEMKGVSRAQPMRRHNLPRPSCILKWIQWASHSSLLKRLWGSLTNLACQRLASFVYEFTVLYQYLSTFGLRRFEKFESWLKSY